MEKEKALYSEKIMFNEYFRRFLHFGEAKKYFIKRKELSLER